MTPKAKSKRGRPRLEGTVLVRLRLSESVYDAYCRRALRAQLDDVRTLLRRTLTVHVRRDDLTPQEARALALRLLLTADEIERSAPPSRPRNFCAPKIGAIPA